MSIIDNHKEYADTIVKTFNQRMDMAMRSAYAWHNPNSELFASNHVRMAIGMLKKINDASDLPVDEQKAIAKRYTKQIMGVVDKLNLWAQGKYD